jgi:hypothetical protein
MDRHSAGDEEDSKWEVVHALSGAPGYFSLRSHNFKVSVRPAR